jgi:hypothetical protein
MRSLRYISDRTASESLQGQLQPISRVRALLFGGKHSNNILDADLLIRMALAIPFHKPCSASHGGHTHFWVVAIPIVACGYRVNSRRKRQYHAAFWFSVAIPHICAHLTTNSQTPIVSRHLVKHFLPACVDFPQRILERIRVELHPRGIIFWHSCHKSPIIQCCLESLLVSMANFDSFQNLFLH